MTLDEFLARITPVLDIYRQPKHATNSCADVSEAIRIAARKQRIPLKLGTVTVHSVGHNVLYTDTEIIDFTFAQFKKGQPFPFRCKINTPRFRRIYGEVVNSENDWDWELSDSELSRDLIRACRENKKTR